MIPSYLSTQKGAFVHGFLDCAWILAVADNVNLGDAAADIFGKGTLGGRPTSDYHHVCRKISFCAIDVHQDEAVSPDLLDVMSTDELHARVSQPKQKSAAVRLRSLGDELRCW